MKAKTLKCKHCRDPHTPFNSIDNWCKKVDCQTAKAMDYLDKQKKQKKKDWDKEKADFKENDKSLSRVANDTQKIFNEFIRLRDEGLVCISCQKPPKKKNAGHYHNANNHWSVRYDEDNVHLQCEACNNNLSGNLIPYRKHLIDKIGTERFLRLESICQITMKYSRDELYDIKEIYRQKLKALKEARKNGISQIGEIDLAENKSDDIQNTLF